MNRRIRVQVSQDIKRGSTSKLTNLKGARDMIQAVECLHSKHEANQVQSPAPLKDFKKSTSFLSLFFLLVLNMVVSQITPKLWPSLLI
jgi:hypothetical protein